MSDLDCDSLGSGVRFVPGDIVHHVHYVNYMGRSATVVSVDVMLDPDEDQVTVEYDWQGQRKRSTLSAWMLRRSE